MSAAATTQGAREDQAPVARCLHAPPAPRNFDLVLCRNVLLYFDAKTRAKAFECLAQGMAQDGWLMMGSGETTIGQTALFETSDEGANLYRHCRGEPSFKEHAREALVG